MRIISWSLGGPVGGAVAGDPGGVPFFAVDNGCAGEVGAVSAEREHVLDAPSDDEVDDDGDVQALDGFELEVFDATPGFRDKEKDFALPAADVSAHEGVSFVVGDGAAVGQHDPVERFDSG